MRWPLPLLLLLLWGGPGQAQIRVDVKARAWLDAVRATSRGADVQISGVLRDNLNQPVAGARLRVRLAGSDAEALAETDAGGHFQARLPSGGAEGRRIVQIDFAGGALLSSASARALAIVGRTAVTLGGELPPQIAAHRERAVQIYARDASGVAVAPLHVRASLDDRPPRDLFLGPTGATLDLPRLPPGPHRLVVSWAGDEARRPARWARDFHAATALAIELRYSGPDPALAGAPLALEGRISIASGALPAELPEIAVLLTAGGVPVGRTATDSAGRFRLVLDPEALPPARTPAEADGARSVRLRAISDARDPTLFDGRSPPVEIWVPPPPPPSPMWVWVPLGAAMLSLLGAGWRRRPAPRPPRPAPVHTPPPAPFEQAPPHSRAAPAGLDVLVLDALDGQPLAAATVVLLGRDEPTPDRARAEPPAGRAHRTDDRGFVHLEGPARSLWAGAPGYAPEQHPCHLPPGGHATVRLTPLRARIQILYGEALRAAGRPRLRFGRETPRQAASALRRRGAAPDTVARLTALVERACFAPEAPEPATLSAAYQLIDALSDALSDPPRPGSGR